MRQKVREQRCPGTLQRYHWKGQHKHRQRHTSDVNGFTMLPSHPVRGSPSERFLVTCLPSLSQSTHERSARSVSRVCGALLCSGIQFPKTINLVAKWLSSVLRSGKPERASVPFERALETVRSCKPAIGGGDDGKNISSLLPLARCLFHAGEARRQNREFAIAQAFLEEAAAIITMKSSAGPQNIPYLVLL